jgi:hypothetical protein
MPALSSGGKSDEKSIHGSPRTALPVSEIFLRSGKLFPNNPASSHVHPRQESRYESAPRGPQERAHILLIAAGRSSRYG